MPCGRGGARVSRLHVVSRSRDGLCLPLPLVIGCIDVQRPVAKSRGEGGAAAVCDLVVVEEKVAERGQHALHRLGEQRGQAPVADLVVAEVEVLELGQLAQPGSQRFLGPLGNSPLGKRRRVIFC